MGESARVELQVGHLCNNRCVFCISGHLTHLRQAPLIADELLKQRYARHRKIGVYLDEAERAMATSGLEAEAQGRDFAD